MTTVKKYKPRVSREWLEQEYITKGRDCVQIGAELGKDPSTIRGWLVTYGIPTRPRGANGGAAAHAFKKGEPSRFKGQRHTPENRELFRQHRLADGRVPYLVDGIHHLKGVTGPAHPSWQGGLTPERQAFNNSREWKEAARAVWIRDGYHCRRCGCRPPSKGPKHNRGHVHHIVSFQVRELRTVLTNLVLLCADCHRWVHGKANVNREFLRPADGAAYVRAAAGEASVPALFDLPGETPADAEAS